MNHTIIAPQQPLKINVIQSLKWVLWLFHIIKYNSSWFQVITFSAMLVNGVRESNFRVIYSTVTRQVTGYAIKGAFLQRLQTTCQNVCYSASSIIQTVLFSKLKKVCSD